MTIELCPTVAQYLDEHGDDDDNFVEWLLEHQETCEWCQRVLKEIRDIKAEDRDCPRSGVILSTLNRW